MNRVMSAGEQRPASTRHAPVERLQSETLVEHGDGDVAFLTGTSVSFAQGHLYSGKL